MCLSKVRPPRRPKPQRSVAPGTTSQHEFDRVTQVVAVQVLHIISYIGVSYTMFCFFVVFSLRCIIMAKSPCCTHVLHLVVCDRRQVVSGRDRRCAVCRSMERTNTHTGRFADSVVCFSVFFHIKLLFPPICIRPKQCPC